MNALHRTQKCRKNRTRHAPRDAGPHAEREEYGLRWAPLAGLFLLAVIPACAEPHVPHGAECRDIPKDAIPAPPGTYVCQWTAAEASRAEADKFVVYQYEWQRDQEKLGPFGERHLAQITSRLACVPYPVVIESSGDAALDESRRLAMLRALSCGGLNLPPQRVVVGHGEAEPLYSQEAPAIASGVFSNRAAGGGLGGGGGGGGSLGIGGDGVRALAEYKKALAAAPKDADVQNDFGCYYYRRGNYAEAEPFFRKALSISPEHQQACMNLALVLAHQGHFEESYKAFARVVGPVAAHSNVGVLLAKVGHNDEARQEFRQALALDSTLKQPQAFLVYMDKPQQVTAASNR